MQGRQGLIGVQGRQGRAGYQGQTGSQGPAGVKNAIITLRYEDNEEYVALSCVEMPEVRFEDIMIIHIGGNGTNVIKESHQIEEKFIKVCEQDSIIVTGIVTSKPISAGVDVNGDKVLIEAHGDFLANEKVKVILRLSGIRIGVKGRFFTHTYEEMIKNNNFWNSWK